MEAISTPFFCNTGTAANLYGSYDWPALKEYDVLSPALRNETQRLRELFLGNRWL